MRNTSAVVQSGLDLQVSYDWSTPVGEWGVRFNGAKVLGLERALVPGLDWLMTHVFVSAGERYPNGVVIRFWKVL